MTGPAGAGGLSASVRRLADTALGLLHTRLALFGTELEQEKLRLFDVLVRAALGLVMAALALVLALGFVVLLVQDGYRLAAVGVLALAFAGGAWGLLRSARGRLHGPEGGPFALSLAELRRDRDGLAGSEPPADTP